MKTDIETFRRILREESARLGVELLEHQLDSFCLHYELLRTWNMHIRLTGSIEPARAAIELFADSLVACKFIESLEAGDPTSQRLRFIDIGAGAGFPSIPLKIIRHRWEAVLVDANAKKISFIKTLLRELGLGGIEVIRGRAEELAHGKGLREAFDLAFCRAVTAPGAACELALPFLTAGGSFIAQTSARQADDLAHHPVATSRAGGDETSITIARTMTYSLTGILSERRIFEMKKKQPTPYGLPKANKTFRRKPSR